MGGNLMMRMRMKMTERCGYKESARKMDEKGRVVPHVWISDTCSTASYSCMHWPCSSNIQQHRWTRKGNGSIME
jgi:hypothetical protein